MENSVDLKEVLKKTIKTIVELKSFESFETEAESKLISIRFPSYNSMSGEIVLNGRGIEDRIEFKSLSQPITPTEFIELYNAAKDAINKKDSAELKMLAKM